MSLNDKHILAIDLGTRGPKVVLISVRGEIAAWEFEPIPLVLLPNGGAEQSPDDWWNALVRATQRVLATRVVPIENIVGLAASLPFRGVVNEMLKRYLDLLYGV